ncbi:MAG: GHKL domain-containing protein [Candidatus Aminicenantes bacterium]|nr:GHKL domain-containing protein [Candidatus Aminicenantes bacterium]NIN23584.1 GHKL domain-containing protein [Candidatus Aminicenantes bacterium]NIN47291.1 GHKL domain-containing protein [Candidatus Aminicenantes bacterium]NIN90220.1 GHKL domain-containing protein [Candidatus Aminicenantes bacterium]NIO86873.1 GHKL domain-containing protein [Candidatus Aminicenantes bacterium]
MLGVEDKKVVLELKDIYGNTHKSTKLEDLSILPPADNMEVGIIAIEDIDADGRKDMLWRISGEHAGLPRGIAVYDPLSGKKKWEFLFGPAPFRTIVKDIDRDGEKEIIFSAWAPHNGFSCNGMDDDHSYVGVLDCRGTQLWCFEVGWFFTNAYLAVEDLNHDGKFEIITSRRCHRTIKPDPGQIRVYDALSGEDIHTSNYPGLSFNDLYVINMDNDPHLEIIASDTQGGLRIWGRNFKVCKEYRENKDIRILGVEKINENSFPLIFTWYAYNTLRIFDHRLRIIFNYQFYQIPKEIKYPDPIVPVNDGKNNSFVLTLDQTYLISPKQAILFQDFLKLFRSPFLFYFLGIIVFNGFVYIGWRQTRKSRLRSLELLRDGTKTKPEWTLTTQEVLHKMKSPLTAILWETEKIDGLLEKKRQSKTLLSKLKKINEAILADVNALKIMNSFLMKYLQVQIPRLQEIEITKIIKESLDNYRNTFGNIFTFTCSFPPSLPTFLADEEQLKEALAIIIDNAIDAMPAGGTISITAAYYKMLPHKRQKNVICIEIEDNGCGITEDKLDKIFDLHYTTKKEGTGIGLAIAKRIVESHDGWIEVESKEKIGTKLALYFPVKNLP